MLRRTVKIQLIIFVALTLVGVSYVSANYVGLFNGLFGSNACTVYADFTGSGGIFTNAEVTYRGVSVGKVGNLDLTKKGVQVALNLSDCSSEKIPVDTAATVSDRSVIGEQYVNLIPPNDNGPYLHGGEVIPMSRTSIPVAPEQLLRDMDSFATSVPPKKLAVVVRELGKAFSNRGQDLGRLIDAQHQLLTTAQQNLPQTIELLRYGATVMQTQLDERSAISTWAHDLNLLAQQLVKSDPDLRRLFNTGPTSLSTVRNFVTNNRTDIGVVLANAATLGAILTRHLPGIEEVLELYPALAAGGQTVIRPDGVAALGIISYLNNPKDCGDPHKASQGYGGTVHRSPDDLSPQAPNVYAHCTAPLSSGTNVRGSAHVPLPEPYSYSGGSVAYPRATTSDTVQVGTQLDGAGALGDGSWEAILTAGLH